MGRRDSPTPSGPCQETRRNLAWRAAPGFRESTSDPAAAEVLRSMEALFALVLAVGTIVFVVVLSSSAEQRRSRLRLIETLRGRGLKNAGQVVDLDDRLVVPFELEGRKARLVV